MCKGKPPEALQGSLRIPAVSRTARLSESGVRASRIDVQEISEVKQFTYNIRSMKDQTRCVMRSSAKLDECKVTVVLRFGPGFIHATL